MTTTAPDSEELRVSLWRVEQFEGLGFKTSDAEWLALSDVDWHEAARLIDAGCPVPIALQLLT